jgi:hypothetical protein
VDRLHVALRHDHDPHIVGTSAQKSPRQNAKPGHTAIVWSPDDPTRQQQHRPDPITASP